MMENIKEDMILRSIDLLAVEICGLDFEIALLENLLKEVGELFKEASLKLLELIARASLEAADVSRCKRFWQNYFDLGKTSAGKVLGIVVDVLESGSSGNVGCLNIRQLAEAVENIVKMGGYTSSILVLLLFA